MPSPETRSADKPSKAPPRGGPGHVMVVRTRPSVHGNSLPQTLPNSKLLTKGRYELSSVRSSSTTVNRWLRGGLNPQPLNHPSG